MCIVSGTPGGAPLHVARSSIASQVRMARDSLPSGGTKPKCDMQECLVADDKSTGKKGGEPVYRYMHVLLRSLLLFTYTEFMF